MSDAALFMMPAAFGLGAAHALEPGHGKFLMTAYLVGNQSRLKEALWVGLAMAFCHTVSVFVVGLLLTGVLGSFSQSESQIYQALEVVSGLIILGVGLVMGYRLWQNRSVQTSGIEDTCHSGHCSYSRQQNNIALKPTSLKDLLLLGGASGLCPSPLPLIFITSTLVSGGFQDVSQALGYLFVFSLGLASIMVVVSLLFVMAKQASQHWRDNNPWLTSWVSFIQWSTAAIIGFVGVVLVLQGLELIGHAHQHVN